MEKQLSLPMMTVYSGPSLVDRDTVTGCKSYREAVRTSWALCKRKRPGYTQRQLAEDIGCYASHVTDYLHGDDAATRRDLPAKRINAFEQEMGNRLVSQWIAWQSSLPVLDASCVDHLFHMRKAA